MAEDEVVILKETGTDSDGKEFSLTLTNKKFVHTYKKSSGFFGTETVSDKYPLIDLRVHDGKPNVIVGKTTLISSRLDVYFINNREFHLTFASMVAAKKWAAAITKAYKECAAQLKKEQQGSISDRLNSFIAPVKEKVSGVQKSIAEKAKELADKKREKNTKANKCPLCGAELVGEKGTEVICPYCSAKVKIK